MFNEYITMESFGQDCPRNWEEIADYLNDIIDGMSVTDEDGELTTEGREKIANLWERYCAGELEGAPVPSAEPWEDTRWVVIDDCTSTQSAEFTDILDVATQEEAITEAKRLWNTLSKYDQDRRDAYYVCKAIVDGDGAIDYNSISDVYEIKA